MTSDRNFCDDIRRSSSSAPRNIAEGFGRFWPGEFSHRLHIAVGELEETQDHLDKALEQRYISADEHLKMYSLADNAIGAAVRFIEYLDGARVDWKKRHLAKLRERHNQRRAQRANTANQAKSTSDLDGNARPDMTTESELEPGGRPGPEQNDEPGQNHNQNQNQNQNPEPEPRTRTQNREPRTENREP